jgi:hypothetical protein
MKTQNFNCNEILIKMEYPGRCLQAESCLNLQILMQVCATVKSTCSPRVTNLTFFIKIIDMILLTKVSLHL